MSNSKDLVKSDGFFAKYQRYVLEPLMASAVEISRLFPDSILFGSLILYVITQNLSYGIFSVFLLETALLHKIASFLFANVSPPAKRVEPASGIACRPGFRMPRLEVERVFMSDTYPSISMVFMGAIASYMASAAMTFSETLKDMGPDWQSRGRFCYIAIILLTVVFTVIRLMGCDSTSELLLALFIGIIGGIFFFMANYNLFGIEGINFLGLPYLQTKTETGNPLYVCVPNSASGN
jgi:hypothetical protein